MKGLVQIVKTANNIIYKLVADKKLDPQDSVVLLSELQKNKQPIENDEIAIIGMSGKFPGSENLEEYWENLMDGRLCIGKIPPDRGSFVVEIMEGTDRSHSKAGYIKEIDKFDAAFFRISPKEAKYMDPIQRVFLETAWEAIEDAGYGGDRLYGSNTGVYTGNDHTWGSPYKYMIQDIDPLAITGSWSGILASRLSYILNLSGPALVIDTACSSGLVAVHEACNALKAGKCQMAIAGGIHIIYKPIEKNEMGIVESNDSTIRAFDDKASGTVWGEGVGVVVLKPLKKAMEDKDEIYAVIKGSAVNNDGASNGITAPKAEAQEDLLIKAWKEARINPENISYIETHGTGTVLGDPIEIKGLSRAFRQFTKKNQFCGIGSVKTNLGHLVGASGIASLIKTVLAINKKVIPPTLNFEYPNRYIDFSNTPVYVNDKTTFWEADQNIRLCGVSSFGFSGTNCHVVIQEVQKEIRAETASHRPMVFTLSAKSQFSIKELVQRYLKFINRPEAPPLKDICCTTAVGRGHYNYRAAIIVRDMDELKEKLIHLREIIDVKQNHLQDIYFGEHRIVSSKKGLNEANDITEDERREISQEADLKLKAFLQGEVHELEELCRLYTTGADIDWNKFYEGTSGRTVHLPPYPFERNRYWIDSSKGDKTRSGTPEKSKNRLYEIKWVPCAEEYISSINTKPPNETVAIFMDTEGIGEGLASNMTNKGIEVIQVRPGESYEKKNELSYTISGGERDYYKLFEDMGDKKISKIIHLCNSSKQYGGSPEELECSRIRGLYSLFHTVKSFTKVNPGHSVEMVLVSRNTFSVDKQEKKANPGNVALFALGRVISAEYENIRCRGVDLDTDTDVNNLVSEMYGYNTSYLTAIRDGKRYIQEFARLELGNGSRKRIDIKSQGVYIITGGLGGIGLEIAKHLSRKGAGNIALVNRCSMPERHEWAEILKASADTKLCQRINAVNSIEADGTAVFCYQGDISVKDQLVDIINKIREKFKNINGIIHCAGIAGEGLISGKSQADFSKVLSPKIEGTLMLDNVTREDEIDFFVTFSSVMSILNVPGQGDYAAANAFMDSFAQWRSFQEKRTVSISWPAWKDTGMAAEYKADKNKSLFKPISVEQALSDFELILESGSTHVIAGELDFEMLSGISEDIQLFKLENDIAAELESTVSSNSSISAKESLLPAVKLKGGVEGNYTKLEKLIGNIWGAILEIGELSIHDDFYDLGGNSLLSINMASKLKEQLNVEIDINSLFEHFSIADLAVFISEKYPESAKEKIFVNEGDKATGNLPEINKIEIENSIINQISGLMWRQMNCLDRGFGVLLGQQNKELLRLFKLFLGIKRCFNLEGYLGDIYSKQTFYNGNLVENQLLESFGLKACVKKVNTLDSLHTTICSDIDKGKPVLVCFDEYFTFYSSFYLSKHTNHLAVINGYDSSKRLYSVIDYNHLMQNGAKIIDYGQFYTTFDTLEQIYSNTNDMEILVMEKHQDVSISGIANKLAGLFEYISQNKLQSEDLVFIKSIIESDDKQLDAEGLNKLYSFLGSKELLISTLKDFFEKGHIELLGMSKDILETSNALINICAAGLIRGRSIKLDRTVVKNIDSISKTSEEFFEALKNISIV